MDRKFLKDVVFAAFVIAGALLLAWAVVKGVRSAVAGETHRGFAVPLDANFLKVYVPEENGVRLVWLWGVETPRITEEKRCARRAAAGFRDDPRNCGARESIRGLWTILTTDSGVVSCQEMHRAEGRVVYARCVLADGERDVAEIMLRNGWAWSVLADGSKLAEDYAAAEKLAREQKVGLWEPREEGMQ